MSTCATRSYGEVRPSLPHAPLSFPSLPCDTRSASSHLPRPWSPHHPLRPAMCSQTCSPPPAPSALRPRTPRRSLAAHRCAIWAPKPPSPAARPLTRAACARRRTVCALSFESAHHPGLYPHVFFELRTDMCGSRPAGCVARSAGATRVRPAGVPRCVIFRRSHGHISGPHEALGLILGGSDTYG